MSAERIPAQVFHAAQYVADEAIARDWSIWDFVDRIGTLNPAVDVLAEIERLRQLVAGFTQADVDLLRCLWSSAQENGNPLSFEESNAADLASRIASTLPPPTP